MSEPVPSRWSNLRDSFAAIREMLIVVAMLALLLTPTSVRSILERAGIRSVAGVEFDTSTLQESHDQLIAAQTQVDELRNELALTQQQFNQVAASTGNTSNPKYTEVSELLARSRQKLDATDNSLGRSRSMQDYLMKKFSGIAGKETTQTDNEPSNTSSSTLSSPTTAERVLMPPRELFKY
jgi:hypothetical protein